MTFITTTGYKNYFHQAPFLAHYYGDFRCDLTEAAAYIKNHDNIKVISDGFSFETIRYLILPNKIDYELPEDFIKNSNKQDSVKDQEIIVISYFGEFNEDLLDLLSANFQEKSIKNKFDDIDFFIFSKED